MYSHSNSGIDPNMLTSTHVETDVNQQQENLEEIENLNQIKKEFDDSQLITNFDLNLANLVLRRCILSSLMKGYVFEDQIMKYEKILEKNPTCVEALIEKAKNLVSLQKFEDALECCNQAISIDASFTQAYFEKGIFMLFSQAKILCKQQKIEEAIKTYEAILSKNSKNNDAIQELSQLQNQIQQISKALKYYDQLLAFDRKNKFIYIEKAKLLQKQNKFELALKCCDQLLTFDPYEKYAYLQKALLFSQINEPQSAIECYKKVIEIDSTNKYAYLAKVKLLMELKNYEKALKCCDKILNFDPKEIYAQIQKARTLECLQKYDQAVKCWDEIISQEQNKSEPSVEKARVLVKQNKIKDAVKCLDIILSNNKANRDTNVQKGINQNQFQHKSQCSKDYWNRLFNVANKSQVKIQDLKEPGTIVVKMQLAFEGQAFKFLNQLNDALKCYEEILKTNSNDWYSQYQVKEIKEQIKKQRLVKND